MNLRDFSCVILIFSLLNCLFLKKVIVCKPRTVSDNLIFTIPARILLHFFAPDIKLLKIVQFYRKNLHEFAIKSDAQPALIFVNKVGPWYLDPYGIKHEEICQKFKIWHPALFYESQHWFPRIYMWATSPFNDYLCQVFVNRL